MHTYSVSLRYAQEFKLLTGRSTEAGLERDFVLKNYNKCLVDLTTFGEKNYQIICH